MRFTPHNYQSYATEFILSHPVAAILLQMGLGKSVITLTAIKALLEKGEVSRVLVIAPLRVARDTWPEELRKWDHLHGLTYAVAVGNAVERRAALMTDSAITIINRENIPWLVEQSGIRFRWDMVVVDELSSFNQELECQAFSFSDEGSAVGKADRWADRYTGAEWLYGSVCGISPAGSGRAARPFHYAIQGNIF